MAIDFDPSLGDVMKQVNERMEKINSRNVRKRLKEEKRERKRREKIKERKQPRNGPQKKQEAKASGGGGMPGASGCLVGGMPGGGMGEDKSSSCCRCYVHLIQPLQQIMQNQMSKLQRKYSAILK